MSTLEQMLHGQSLLIGLNKDQLERLARCSNEVRFDAGELIVAEGDAADHFWLIETGSVALQVRIPGRGPVIIETIGHDDLLGWSWLVEPYRWRFDAQAVEPVVAIEFDAACVTHLCDDDPALGYALLQRFAAVIGERLQATRVRLLDMYGGGGR